MGALNDLPHPEKSHRKKVTLPKYSTELAEFFGIMLGDGGINNPWQANISMNAVKDKVYARYIIRLIQRLFAITAGSFAHKQRDSLRLYISSTSLVDFLVSKGIPRGDKLKYGLAIPTWILEKPAYRKACVRGLVDTDGCIFIHRHRIAGKEYRNIGLTFTSYSRELIGQVAAIFEEFGIMPHITVRGTDIYLYREEAVARYLKVFGSSNERIASVHKKWKRGRAVEGARLESV